MCEVTAARVHAHVRYFSRSLCVWVCAYVCVRVRMMSQLYMHAHLCEMFQWAFVCMRACACKGLSLSMKSHTCPCMYAHEVHLYVVPMSLQHMCLVSSCGPHTHPFPFPHPHLERAAPLRSPPPQALVAGLGEGTQGEAARHAVIGWTCCHSPLRLQRPGAHGAGGTLTLGCPQPPPPLHECRTQKKQNKNKCCLPL